MLKWVDPFMWWLIGTMGYLMELVGVLGLLFIVGHCAMCLMDWVLDI